MIIAGAAFAMIAIIIGAFAAHGLKQSLDAYALGLVETAARYQMYHALALMLVGVISMASRFSTRWLKLAAIAFAVGIFLFSGSLYLLALSGIRWWGAITPVGGVAFILGWIALIVASLHK
ncbi:MAG: DUF423 domain-containing protein [Gammaproteobacteria bacterium]|nr:MAG: DUF423 domain-containing protein [Gammaproteobacteria bacterium]